MSETASPDIPSPNTALNYFNVLLASLQSLMDALVAANEIQPLTVDKHQLFPETVPSGVDTALSIAHYRCQRVLKHIGNFSERAEASGVMVETNDTMFDLVPRQPNSPVANRMMRAEVLAKNDLLPWQELLVNVLCVAIRETPFVRVSVCVLVCSQVAANRPANQELMKAIATSKMFATCSRLHLLSSAGTFCLQEFVKQPCQQLKSINFNGFDFETESDLESMIEALKTLQLTQLVFHRCQFDASSSYAQSIARLVATSRQLEKFGFACGSDLPLGLASIIRLCPHLKSLTCNETFLNQCELANVMDALAENTTLRSLSITVSKSNDEWELVIDNAMQRNRTLLSLTLNQRFDTTALCGQYLKRNKRIAWQQSVVEWTMAFASHDINVCAALILSYCWPGASLMEHQFKDYMALSELRVAWPAPSEEEMELVVYKTRVSWQKMREKKNEKR